MSRGRIVNRHHSPTGQTNVNTSFLSPRKTPAVRFVSWESVAWYRAVVDSGVQALGNLPVSQQQQTLLNPA